MKLGIDFGTNRTVVAAADRGNYPLVSFEAPDGATPDWFPSLIAFRGIERCYGWDAWDAQADTSWTMVRSIKRLLEDAGPETLLAAGDQQIRVFELLTGLTSALYVMLRESSNLRLSSEENLEAVLGVPAHANSNQRFLTVEAFRKAGFHVLGVLNEPSAASIEFGYRQKRSATVPETILVYDLGGGTFDASLVTLDEKVHHVLASEGISTIGGDDFDQILADLALEAGAITQVARDEIGAPEWFRLLEECRRKKESLHPNSRRLVIDLEHANPEWPTVNVPVTEFYEAARSLVEETVHAAEDLLAHRSELQFEALYLTGGASELPLIARVLRERFGRRVRRSAYTRSATAIGLAIQAEQPERYQLNEHLQRFFGVWRESDGGSRVVFDPILERGVTLPSAGQPNLLIRRRYSPAHNIGHFRFLECSHRTVHGSPTGEVTFWDEILFPFDPDLESVADLNAVPIEYSSDAMHQHIEERYECDSSGSIQVTIANQTAGYSRNYQLGQWSAQTKSAKPASKAKKAKA